MGTVNGIDGDIKLNKGLWVMTQKRPSMFLGDNTFSRINKWKFDLIIENLT